MTTQLDYSVGIGKEETYGTGVTPARFFESDASMKYDRQQAQGKAFRPGKRVNQLNRHVLNRIEVSGDMTLEATTKGLGFLLQAVFGTVANTVIADTDPAVYQQVHTLRSSDPVDSYTIQEVLPTIGGGTGQPHTFTGCIANSIDINAKEGSPLELKVAWLGRDMNTDTAAAATSYPTDDDLLTFVHGSIGYEGTLTEPTTTALAALSGDAASNIVDFAVTVANNLDTDGYTLGGAGLRARPNLLGKAGITGKLTAEYTDNTLRDAYIDQTPLPLVLTFVHERVLSEEPDDTFAVLQIVLPSVRLKGEIPTSNDGSAIQQSIDFEAFDNGSATEPIWVIYRTLDTTV